MPRRARLSEIVGTLQRHYAAPEPPDVTGVFEMILWENVAYLVDDQRRRTVWERLSKKIGTTPQAILRAPVSTLVEVIRDGGMQPEHRAEKLRTAARIACEDFDEDLEAVLALPLAQARRALKKFPGIGDPGADKLLLFTRTAAVLGLESNGLRVLQRLGFGAESDDYSKAYRSVQAAIAPEVGNDYGFLIRAHQLLRQHGKTLCRRTAPLCRECPLGQVCPSAEIAQH